MFDIDRVGINELIRAVSESIPIIDKDYPRNQELISFKDIRYEPSKIILGTHEIEVNNGRESFVRALSCYLPRRPKIIVGNQFIHGENCTIGGAGFGYEGGIPVPHLGGVWIGDNVTLHNSVNIDRGVTGNTVIGSGSKIDSLVHVAHNAQIGENCLIVAGAIIGGSAEIGEGTFVGMNASVLQKIKIGKFCVIGAGAVVTKNVPDGETWAGVPAKKIA